MVDESMLIDTLDMDAMYDLEEGGGACVTCYKQIQGFIETYTYIVSMFNF